MSFDHRLSSLAPLALAGAILSLSACHSGTKTQTAGSPSPQASQAQPPQPASPTAEPAGSQTSASSQPAPSGQPAPQGQPPTPPPPAVVELAAGTRLPVRLDQDLGSKISQPGDTFRATVSQDVQVNGEVVIPRGARAEGTVVDAKALGHFKGGARLELRLERVHTKWGSYPVATSTIERAEKGKGKRSAGFIGGGAGLGAIIGGIAGGGKGAAIGALAGGGAGTAGGALTGNKQIFLPAETLLTFRLQRPVHITQQE